MNLGKYVLKAGDVNGHTIAAGAGLDAIRNLYNGIATGNESYYQMAALEALISVGIEVSKYFDRRRRESLAMLMKYVPKMNEMEKRIDADFQRLFDRIDNLNLQRRK